MILHEQSKDISKNISVLDERIRNLGYPEHAIHVGLLIRRESIYKDDLMEERKRLFSAPFNFARKLPFSYISVNLKQKECVDVVELTSRLSKSISEILAVQNMKKIATILADRDLLQSFLNFLLKYSNPPKFRRVCQ